MTYIFLTLNDVYFRFLVLTPSLDGSKIDPKRLFPGEKVLGVHAAPPSEGESCDDSKRIEFNLNVSSSEISRNLILVS